MSNLTSRIFSASIGIPIIFILVFFGGTQGIATLVLLVTCVLGYELSRMAKAGGVNGHIVLILVLILPLTSIIISLFESMDRLITFGIATLVGLFFISLQSLFLRYNLKLLFVFVIAALVYGLSLAHVPEFTKIHNGVNWLMLVLITTFSIDTCGFFIGSRFGKHLLLPRVSPRKTWEGLGGSLIGGIITSVFVNHFLNLEMGLWASIFTGSIMAILAVNGDLYASWLKRKVNFKNSGFLIPGHGGILDRVDSIAPNFVFIYWIAQWSGA